MPADLYRVILPVSDIERAAAFWSALLGVEIDRAVPNRYYLATGGALLVLVDPVAHAGGHGDGHARFAPNPDWLYLRVTGLEAVLERARELGAQVVGPYGGAGGIERRDWGDVSFYARDPFGNPLCFVDDEASDLRPEAAHYASPGAPALRNLSLPTSNLGRAEAFYESLLECPADTTVPGRPLFLLPSCQLMLVDPAEHARAHGLPASAFRANPDLIYFSVPDLEACRERAQKLRIAPLDDDPHVSPEIRAYPWGERSFYGKDPSGNPVCFVDETTLYLGFGRPPGG